VYDAEAGTVTLASDKAEGPTAGRHSFDAAKFIALLVAQIPDKGQVLQRAGTGACPYIGYYANRTRGERRKAQAAAATAGSDGDGGEMRVVALIQAPAVIDKILGHLREKGRDARAGPFATGPPGDGAGAEKV
jgi:hypothetical protein